MRSPASTRRRLRSRPPRHRLLPELATFLDSTWIGATGPVLFHGATPDADGIDLGAKALEPGTHPFPAVAGLSAPPHWHIFGVRALGTARHLDDGTAARVAATFLTSRDGEEAFLLRTGEGAVVAPEPPSGTIPDMCRRVLGLPTPPAPATTALLWTTVWLDAVLARWSAEPAERRGLSRSFAAVAALHPAARAGAAVTSPAELASAARLHSALWPWSRLRAEPDSLDLPDGPLPPDVTAWMDDGFFARWCLGAYPHPADLARDVCGLVGPAIGADLAAAVGALVRP